MSITAMPPDVRDRLDDVRGRLAELRKRRQRALDHVNACKQALNASSGAPNVNSEEFRRAERAVNDLKEIQSSISLTEQEEKYVLSRIAGLDGPMQRENFLSDPNVLEELRSLANSTTPIGNLGLGYAISRDELLADFDRRRELTGFGLRTMGAAGDVTIPDTARQTVYYGVVPQLRRRLRLMDLIPTSPMEGKSFDYTQESGSFDTAAETVEATVKPTGAVTMTDAQVVAKTIAHWVKVPRQQLADVPALGTTLNSRLIYGVERRLESQIIAGDGTGENLTGIIHMTGVGAPASVTGDSVNSDLALNAIGFVLSSEADPDAVCLNPADFIKMAKVKAAGSGERLDSEGALSAIPTTLWGIPIVISTAIAAGHALVGAFGIGARVFIREGVSVRVSDAADDDFTRNRLTMLGEGRYGLMVSQPTAFAYIPLSFAN